MTSRLSAKGAATRYVDRIIGGGLITLVSTLFLVYGLRFQTIMLLARGSGGMKDRAKKLWWYWAGVAEWSLFAFMGVAILFLGLFPGLLPR